MILFPQIKVLYGEIGGLEYPYVHQIYWDGELFYDFISRYNVTFVQISMKKDPINKNDFISRKFIFKLNGFQMDRFVNRLFKSKKAIFKILKEKESSSERACCQASSNDDKKANFNGFFYIRG